jgi:hypothetical protein
MNPGRPAPGPAPRSTPDASSGGADSLTRAERYRRQFEDHRLGAMVVIVASAIVATGAVIGGLEQIRGLFGDSPAKPSATASAGPTREQPIHLRPSELGRATNARYGFSFEYPLTWERNDPANGDGLLAVGPSDGLEVLAYGGLPLDSEQANDPYGRIESRTAEYMAYLKESGGKVVDGPAQQNVPVMLSSDSSTEVPGSRILVSTPRGPRTPAVKSAVLLATPLGRDVTMECHMPAQQIRLYQGACNQMLSTLTVLRDWTH